MDTSGCIDTRRIETDQRAEKITIEHLDLGGNCQGYSIQGLPGLIIIPSALSNSRQQELIRACLCKHAKRPHQSNLDTHYQVPDEGIWSMYVREKTAIDKEEFKIRARRKEGDDSPETDVSPSSLLYRLRWITLGYKYLWGSKAYDWDSEPLEFPRDIGHIAEEIVQAVTCVEYKAEAGVINYYQIGDTLMGHVDESETLTGLDKPLVSISLGLSCVFLIAEAREYAPTGIILHSGDVVVMSGKSRGYHHGVPRVFKRGKEEVEFDEPFASYMSTTRININVRQVR